MYICNNMSCGAKEASLLGFRAKACLFLYLEITAGLGFHTTTSNIQRPVNQRVYPPVFIDIISLLIDIIK